MNETLTDEEIAERIRLCNACRCGHCKTIVRYARELQALRASDRELRQMVARLVGVLKDIMRRMDDLREIDPDNTTSLEVEYDGELCRICRDVTAVLTPAVRAVAEAAGKEEGNADHD